MGTRTARSDRQRISSRAGRLLALLLIAAFVVFLILPQLWTLIFAFATSWTTTLMPKGLTTKWIIQTLQQRRFFETLLRSILLGLSVIVLDLLLVVPALVVMTVKRTRARILLDMATLFPYTMPGVVLALALIRFYGWLLPAILSTPWLLAAAHASLALPIVYWAVLNNLKAIKLTDLFEAAQTCGARWPQILRLVVLPNIRTGIAISAVAGFAASFTDFAVANFIVGGIWPTFSVWQGGLIRLNSRFMAVTAIVSFLITITTTLIVMRLSRASGPPKSIS